MVVQFTTGFVANIDLSRLVASNTLQIHRSSGGRWYTYGQEYNGSPPVEVRMQVMKADEANWDTSWTFERTPATGNWGSSGNYDTWYRDDVAYSLFSYNQSSPTFSLGTPYSSGSGNNASVYREYGLYDGTTEPGETTIELHGAMDGVVKENVLDNIYAFSSGATCGAARGMGEKIMGTTYNRAAHWTRTSGGTYAFNDNSIGTGSNNIQQIIGCGIHGGDTYYIITNYGTAATEVRSLNSSFTLSLTGSSTLSTSVSVNGNRVIGYRWNSQDHMWIYNWTAAAGIQGYHLINGVFQNTTPISLSSSPPFTGNFLGTVSGTSRSYNYLWVEDSKFRRGIRGRNTGESLGQEKTYWAEGNMGSPIDYSAAAALELEPPRFDLSTIESLMFLTERSGRYLGILMNDSGRYYAVEYEPISGLTQEVEHSADYVRELKLSSTVSVAVYSGRGRDAGGPWQNSTTDNWYTMRKRFTPNQFYIYKKLGTAVSSLADLEDEDGWELIYTSATFENDWVFCRSVFYDDRIHMMHIRDYAVVGSLVHYFEYDTDGDSVLQLDSGILAEANHFPRQEGDLIIRDSDGEVFIAYAVDRIVSLQPFSNIMRVYRKTSGVNEAFTSVHSLVANSSTLGTSAPTSPTDADRSGFDSPTFLKGPDNRLVLVGFAPYGWWNTDRITDTHFQMAHMVIQTDNTIGSRVDLPTWWGEFIAGALWFDDAGTRTFCFYQQSTQAIITMGAIQWGTMTGSTITWDTGINDLPITGINGFLRSVSGNNKHQAEPQIFPDGTVLLVANHYDGNDVNNSERRYRVWKNNGGYSSTTEDWVTWLTELPGVGKLTRTDRSSLSIPQPTMFGESVHPIHMISGIAGFISPVWYWRPFPIETYDEFHEADYLALAVIDKSHEADYTATTESVENFIEHEADYLKLLIVSLVHEADYLSLRSFTEEHQADYFAISIVDVALAMPFDIDGTVSLSTEARPDPTITIPGSGSRGEGAKRRVVKRMGVIDRGRN